MSLKTHKGCFIFFWRINARATPCVSPTTGAKMNISFLSIIVIVASLTTVTSTYSHVLPLKDADFDTTLAESDKAMPGHLWLLEFYAPWCGHCKKLNPILDALAADENVVVNIGKVDCTANKQLKDRFQVRGYPTVKYYRDGQFGEYEGGRSQAEISMWVENMGRPAVEHVSELTEERMKELFVHNGVIVFAAKKDSSAAFDQFQEEAKKMQSAGTNRFVSFDEGDFGKEGGEFIAAFEEGEQARLLKDFTSESVAKWVQENQFPLVSELMSSNFKKLGSIEGKLLYITAIDWSDSEVSNQQVSDGKAATPRSEILVVVA